MYSKLFTALEDCSLSQNSLGTKLIAWSPLMSTVHFSENYTWKKIMDSVVQTYCSVYANTLTHCYLGVNELSSLVLNSVGLKMGINREATVFHLHPFFSYLGFYFFIFAFLSYIWELFRLQHFLQQNPDSCHRKMSSIQCLISCDTNCLVNLKCLGIGFLFILFFFSHV